MTEELFQERVVRVEPPASHYTLLRDAGGRFLGTADGASLATFDHVDDKAVWEPRDAGYRHVATGLALAARDAADFAPGRGPAELPSAALETFEERGWVCLASILEPEIVDALQEASCTGPWEDRRPDRRSVPLTRTLAVARAAVEPVSLWLMRQYLQTDEIRLAHVPSFAVLRPDDGRRDVQGWHSDFPYLWGIPRGVGGDRIPHGSGPAMAVQRNVCVTHFTRENGATCFKLGSHTRSTGPPEAWGTTAAYTRPGHRAEHGLPYSGPEAEVVEAPAGSIILYDARTWHRAGVNRTRRERAGMLQAVTPMYIMPFMDTSRAYKAFLASALHDQLDPLEQLELRGLLVHKIVGPAGEFAITVDDELTRAARGPAAAGRRSY